MVNENIYALIVSGSPLKEELYKAWENICFGFEDAMGNNEHKFYLILFKEVSLLSVTYEQIQFLVNVLTILNEKKCYSEFFYSELNKQLKTSFVFTRNDFAKNAENVKRCFNRSKGIKLQLDLKQDQLNALQLKQGDGKKPTPEYYQSILISLSDHAKYPVTDSITVFEFCERIRRFNQYYEQLKSKQRGSR
jgi:hypothetical protein